MKLVDALFALLCWDAFRIGLTIGDLLGNTDTFTLLLVAIALHCNSDIQCKLLHVVYIFSLKMTWLSNRIVYAVLAVNYNRLRDREALALLDHLYANRYINCLIAEHMVCTSLDSYLIEASMRMLTRYGWRCSAKGNKTINMLLLTEPNDDALYHILEYIDTLDARLLDHFCDNLKKLDKEGNAARRVVIQRILERANRREQGR